MTTGNSDGRPCTEDGFRASWGTAKRRAAITDLRYDLRFHDLRGTAVTRRAPAGGTEVEIATIVGLSLVDMRSILDAHDLARDPALAEQAIAKLEAAWRFPNALPTVVGASSGKH